MTLNGGFTKTIAALLITYAIGFGIYVVNKLGDIKDAASDIKQDVALLKFKMDVVESAMKLRTEDRYTGRDAARDRAEYEKRFQALEKVK